MKIRLAVERLDIWLLQGVNQRSIFRHEAVRPSERYISSAMPPTMLIDEHSKDASPALMKFSKNRNRLSTSVDKFPD